MCERGGGNARERVGERETEREKKVEIVSGKAGVWKLIKLVNQHQSNQRSVIIELKKTHSFIEVYFTYYKIPPFQVYISTNFINFTECWSHHRNSILEHFHSQIRSLMPIYILSPFSPPALGNY